MEPTLENLQQLLKDHEYSPEMQRETGHVYTMLKLSYGEFPCFLRPLDEGALVQILTYFPFNPKPELYGDLSRLLHLIDKELDVPGLGLDEKANLAFYRCVIPTFGGRMEPDVIAAYMKTAELVCESFFPGVAAVGTGQTTLAEIQKRLAESIESESE